MHVKSKILSGDRHDDDWSGVGLLVAVLLVVGNGVRQGDDWWMGMLGALMGRAGASCAMERVLYTYLMKQIWGQVLIRSSPILTKFAKSLIKSVL